MTKHHGDKVNLRSLLSDYVDVQRIESSGARAEIDQLGTLLADAVARLTSSFERIGALTARQRQLTFEAVTIGYSKGQAGTELASDSGDDLGAISADIERHVKEAVTALQFQDIASQLLGHIVKRMELLERMTRLLERVPDGGSEELGRMLASVRTAPDGISVSQASMTQGTVELF